jgi:RHS repeat-associated protein
VQVLSPRALPRVRSGDPEWVGRNPLGQTVARSYERSPGGLLTAIEGLEDERTELPRDASGRVIERRRVKRSHATTLEAFGYGASGDLYEPSKRRSYAPGGRLTEHGDARYVYDEGGRVTQKRMADGSVWDFEWGDNDWLNAVRTPDGRTIRFSYDSFARRTTKQIERDGRIESVTRYAWNGDALAREVREVAQAGGDPVVEERVYAALPGSVLPLAHRDVVSGKASEYRYYVEAPNGAPDALIAGDGTVVGTLDASLYGRVEGDQAALTPLRLPGHYADPETGLHYNRYRYYDPAAGQYLSPEPIRLEGSLRAYAYAEGSPTEIVDLDGLNPDSLPMQGTITGTTSGGDDITGQGTSGYDPDWKKKLHPAVQQALPKTPAPPKEGKFERNPAVCAEPKAMSDYLKKWEEKTGKSADPSTEEGKKNLQQALKDVKNIESKWDGDNKVKQACPNCSQTLPRLWKLAGLDPNDPEHGLNKKMPAGGTSATTPPGWGKPFKPDYKNDSKYPSDDLGKWHYNNGKWEQL